MKSTVIDIKGMHCRSCELLVEDELSKVHNIKKVIVNQSKGIAEVYYEGELNQNAIEKAVSCAGYCLGREDKPLFSKNIKDYRDLGIAAFLAVDLFLVARGLGLLNINLTNGGNYNSLPVVFLIGITAGVSTCMALVGGLVLGASAKFAEKHPNATALEKFKPHLFFNLGRVISYFILGGVIGFAGSFFQLSTSVLGILTISVGMVMLLLGAQLIEIFPILKGITFTLPKSISRMLGIKEQSEKEYSHKNSMIAGAMTFFLPCGFTQAIQLFAISSGSPVTGALALGTFALGTAPGLLGVGGLTAIVKGTAARLFFRTAGIVVILLAVFNISNGYNLTGFNPGGVLATMFSAGPAVAETDVTIENGAQIIRMTQDGSGYHPNSFTVKKGIPVKWVINSTEPYSCAASIVMQKYNIRKSLTAGENIIEFTPTETGSLSFTCSMGMFRGVFNVVDGNNITNQVVAAPTQGASCGSGGCGCGGGAKPQPAVQGTISGQTLKTTYTVNDDIRPNNFTIKAGQPAKLEIDVKEDGYGCMGSITVQSLTRKVEQLRKGTPIVLDLDTSKPGTYLITCGMGVPRGQITIQ